MNGPPTFQSRRTVLTTIGATAVGVGSIGGVVGAVDPGLKITDITSDPRVQAIEAEVGPLDYGTSSTSTENLNEYDDDNQLTGDHEIKETAINTDNGTLHYYEGFIDSSLDATEATLTTFSHPNYPMGDLAPYGNILSGEADGSTGYARTLTDSEVSQAQSLGFDFVNGYKGNNTDGYTYYNGVNSYVEAVYAGSTKIAEEDSGGDDGGGGGGGDDDMPSPEMETQHDSQLLHPETEARNDRRGTPGNFRKIADTSDVETHHFHCSDWFAITLGVVEAGAAIIATGGIAYASARGASNLVLRRLAGTKSGIGTGFGVSNIILAYVCSNQE